MDASAEAVQTATQHKGTVMPISKAAPTLEKVALTADMKVRGGGFKCIGSSGGILLSGGKGTYIKADMGHIGVNLQSTGGQPVVSRKGESEMGPSQQS